MKKILFVFVFVFVCSGCVNETNLNSKPIQKQEIIKEFVKDCETCRKFTDGQGAMIATGAYVEFSGYGAGTPLNNCLSINMAKELSDKDKRIVRTCMDFRAEKEYNATFNYLAENEPDHAFGIGAECADAIYSNRPLIESKAIKKCL
jgi:hypothetical protein